MYKRLALVDPRFLKNNFSSSNDYEIQQTKDESNDAALRQEVYSLLRRDAPLLQVLTQSKRELNAALNDETVPVAERMREYNKALSKHQILMQKYKLDFTEKEDNNVSTTPSYVSDQDDDVLKTISTNIPPAYLVKSKKLYQVLKNSNTIKWDASGNIISIDGVDRVEGNIVDILGDIARERKGTVIRPVGARHVQKLVSKLDPQFKLVKNKLYHKPLHGVIRSIDRYKDVQIERQRPQIHLPLSPILAKQSLSRRPQKRSKQEAGSSKDGDDYDDDDDDEQTGKGFKRHKRHTQLCKAWAV